MKNQISSVWQKVKIDQVVENLDNMRVPVTKSERSKGTIPYYGATGIVDYVDNYIFNEKLLLIGEDGADWSSYANSAYIIEGKSWVNNHAHVLRATKININFLKEYLNYADLTLHISGTTRGKLNKSDLMNIEIPLPPDSVQDSISLHLSSISEEIYKTCQIIQKTEKLKHGLMLQLFSKFPNNKKLGEILDFSQYGLSLKSSPSGKYPMFRMNNFKNGKLIPYPLVNVDLDAKSFDQYRMEKDDILFNRTNSQELVGKTGIFELQGDYVFASYLVRLRANRNIVSPHYLNYYLNSPYAKRQLESMKSRGVSQSNINPTVLKSRLNCPIPSLEDQQAVVDVLNSVVSKLEMENERKEKLLILKRGLMQDIFSQKVQITI